MDNSARQISEALLALEAELRRLHLWDSDAPSVTALASHQPFCCDTLSFPQWLQWILLPRIQVIVAQGGPYPLQSGIHAYAEEWAKRHCPDGLELLHLVKRFDDLIEQRRRAGRD